MLCGLLGRKLGHSYSPQIHKMLGDYQYELFEKEPQDLESFLRSCPFKGLNVTIPYKKDVLPYCSELSEQAQKLGAVNTIIRRNDGSLIGHNTDYFGFLSMLERTGISVNGKKVLVLGSGGASATAVVVLKELGAYVVVISRTGDDNYSNIQKHSDAAVIVNATPVGMYPNVGVSPVDLDNFPNLEGVLDMIYNPARTELLQQAERRGLIAENGLWMLVAQAKESAQWFTGNTIDDNTIPTIHHKLQQQMMNVVLIGMPGSGKSTVGKLLAKKLGKQFIDADTEIEKAADCSIPAIFTNFGEEHFRELETSVLAQLGKRSGLVIATGGGCVTKLENYSHLHQNGILIWLQRNISILPTEGRPLSDPKKMDEMYAIRKPLYNSFADITIENNTSIDETISSILTAINTEV